MYSSTTRVACLSVFCFLIGSLSAGCNVDRLSAGWRYGKAPAEPATPPDRADGEIDISTVEAQEVDLAEAVITHRDAYRHELEALQAYYSSHGYATKESWAVFELEGLDRVKQFRYLMDAEIPSGALRATESIPEADALFQKGLDLMRRGGHGVPALYSRDLMVQAARVFRNLIERFPGSDKIDDAAFYCGEIHKEYMPDQETLAVKWYERVWMWNPQTEHPARFQAAVVYDYRLHDRDRALELYKSVLKHEGDKKGNVRFATRRIHDLTKAGGQPRATEG